MIKDKNKVNKKIVVIGAGENCRKLCAFFRKLAIENILIFDNDEKKWGSNIDDFIVQKTQQWSDDWRCYYISVTNKKARDEISNQLREKNYHPDKEWTEIELIAHCYLVSEILKVNELKKGVMDNNRFMFVYRMPLGLGGVESWIRDIGLKLGEEYGNRIVLLTGENEGAQLEQKRHNCTFLTFEFGKWDFKEVEKIKKLLNIYAENCISKIYVNLLDESFLAAIILKKYYVPNLKIVSVIHNSTEDMLRTNACMSSYIDEYFVVSDYISSSLLKRGIATEKILYMRLPIDVKQQLIRTYSAHGESIKLGFAGRLDGFENSQKRMDLIIKLIKELDEMNVEFFFSIAGDGPAKEAMQEIIRKDDRLVKKVHFLGKLPRNQMNSFWKSQDVCINMADFEGHSISISEAMANGAVPVVTDVSGVRDDVIDGENGFIVPKGDYLLASNLISKINNNKSLLIKLGKNAHKTIYKNNRMSEHIKFWKKELGN